MKSVYVTEILILFVSGTAGVCFYNGGWINYFVGFLLVLETSYFLVSKLKEQTIKEYIKEIQNKGLKNIDKRG